jgi:sugar phosphate isomerase/epimerase
MIRFLFFSLCLALGVSAAEKKPVGTGGSFKGPLGLQMYSLRHVSAKNPIQALDMARDFGFVELESGPGRFKPDEYLKLLSDRGLKLVSSGAGFDQLRTNAPTLAANAKALGVKFVMCSWIPHSRGAFNEKNARDAAEVFNRAGELYKKEGITFTYHIHGYEFQPWKEGTLFDLIAQETKPEFVSFELDVYWAVYGGADPVKLLEKYGSRFALMHVKDLKKGAKGNLIGTGPDEESVAIGQGQVDWPAVLKAAEKAGVKHYFIEDESLDAAKQIPDSIKYLESIRW